MGNIAQDYLPVLMLLAVAIGLGIVLLLAAAVLAVGWLLDRFGIVNVLGQYSPRLVMCQMSRGASAARV